MGQNLHEQNQSDTDNFKVTSMIQFEEEEVEEEDGNDDDDDV